MDNIFIQKSIVMGIGAMTEDDLDLSDSSENRRFMIGGIWPRYAKNVKVKFYFPQINKQPFEDASIDPEEARQALRQGETGCAAKCL